MPTKPKIKTAPPLKKDNSTFDRKVRLRLRLLPLVEHPVVMETHGGYGRVYQRCYRQVPEGVVIEKNPDKAAALALQRPTWSVYECIAETALAGGLGSHLEVNFLDVDPYGEPWPVFDAFFGSKRPFAPRLAVAVNDGLRHKLRLNGGWSVGSLRSVVDRIGNAKLFHQYKDICQDLLMERASRAGYRLEKWTAYYCGAGDDMTHFAAVLERENR